MLQAYPGGAEHKKPGRASGEAESLLQDRENDQYEQTPEGTILKEVSFSMSWETNISNPGAILEAEYCIDTTYPVWKAQIDEIPYGAPYVQANVTQTVGTISGLALIPLLRSLRLFPELQARFSSLRAPDRPPFVMGRLGVVQLHWISRRCSEPDLPLLKPVR